jgi:Fatty acid desaturase
MTGISTSARPTAELSSAVLRHSPRDALLVALAVAHGALLITVPTAPLIALLLWWNANTVSHNFIHLPFFRSRRANALFSIFLSAVLGLPQMLWRDRHVAHHGDRRWRWRWSAQLGADSAAAALVWLVAARQGTGFLLETWLAGWLAGLALCQLQGYFEHVRGTVSHYSTLYNALFFNDGYHVEHHARPGVHWTALPRHADATATRSAWPAVLRWLETSPLDALEQIVLRFPALQRFVVGRHARAFSTLLGESQIRRVTIVGGGLFPRTALVLRQLYPQATLTLVDRSAKNLVAARPFLHDTDRTVVAEYRAYAASGAGADADVLVVPLAYIGEKEHFYARPDAPLVAVHDWLWRRRGLRSVVVSPLLLKRLNLVRR